MPFFVHKTVILRFLLIAAVCVVYGEGRAQESTDNIGSDYVLIVNSHTENTLWSQHIIESTVDALAKREPQWAIFTEHLRTLLIDTPEQLNATSHILDYKYRTPPQMIVYIGNSAWAMVHDHLDQLWGAPIPSLLFSDIDWIGPENVYFSKAPTSVEKRIPITEILKEHPNLTAVASKIYVSETIELMRRLLPRMKELVLISDQRGISSYIRYEAAQVCKNLYPDLRLTHLIEGDIQIDSLIHILQRPAPERGYLLFSWVESKVLSQNFRFLSKASRSLNLYAEQPLFVLLDSDVDFNGGSVAGGFFHSTKESDRLIDSAVMQTLGNGSGNRYFAPKSPHPIFNYKTLQRFNLKPHVLPRYTVFYNKPEPFIVRYRLALIGGFLLLCSMVVGIYIFFIKQRAQKKELYLIRSYRNLFNNMPIAYMEIRMLYDAANSIEDYEINDVNPHFEQTVVTRDKIVGWRGSKIDTVHINPIIDGMKQLIESQKAGSLPYLMQHTGTHYTIIISPSSKPEHMDIFFINNSQLINAQESMRQSKHKLAIALDASGMIPWKWDVQRDLLIFDRNAQNDDEHKEESIEKANYLARIHPEDRVKVEKHLCELRLGQNIHLDFEYRVVALTRPRSGHYEWVAIHAIVDEWDTDGKPSAVIGTLLFCTERKQIELDLIAAKEQAEESNRLKSAFLANMSHEIRTPLNAIVGFSELLAETEELPDRQTYTGLIRSNNDLLLQLINDILDLSKIEAGTLKFTYSEVDLNELTAEIIHSGRLRVKEGVQVEMGDTLPSCHVRTERTRLTQVLTNFMTNAAKFTAHGSIEVGYRMQSRNQIYIYVSDTGCGIPVEKQQCIFDRFVKLNTFSQGSGLGLSICKTIVKQMRGHIGVTSKEGKGSTFWIILPITPAANVAAKTEKS